MLGYKENDDPKSTSALSDTTLYITFLSYDTIFCLRLLSMKQQLKIISNILYPSPSLVHLHKQYIPRNHEVLIAVLERLQSDDLVVSSPSSL